MRLVAILDADKEGFLRSERPLVADHWPRGPQCRWQVILSCDHETGSIKRAMAETIAGVKKQEAYNAQMALRPPRSSAGSRIFWARSMSRTMSPSMPV